MTPPRSRVRTIAVRVAKGVAKGVAWLLGAIVLLVVVAIGVVLWTPWGTGVALRFALERYDAAIPGAATVERIGGTLGGTLVLEDVALRDAEDRPLVAIAELALTLELGPLVTRTLAFEALEVRGVEVWFGAEQANFADLGPPGPSQPKPDGLVGPDLPIGFSGPIVAEHVVVHRNLVQGDPEVLVDAPRLQAHLASMGRRAELRIDGVTAVLPSAALAVADATATLRWDDPEVRVVDLVAWTNLGVVKRGELGFDAWLQTGDADVDASLEVAALAGGAALPIVGPVATHVRASGGAAQLWVQLAVRAEPEASVDLLLVGSIAPRLELAGLGGFAVIPPGATRAFHGSVAAQVARAPDEPLRAAVQLGCVGCRDPLGVHVGVVAQAPGGTMDIDARVFAADATVVADATLDGAIVRRAHARVEIPSLRRVEAELAPWLTLPPVAGAVAVSAACAGDDTVLACTTQLEARAVAYVGLAVGHAELAAEVAIEAGMPRGTARLHASDLSYGAQRVDRLDVVATGDVRRLDVDVRAVADRSRGQVVATLEPGPRTRIGLERVELLHRAAGRRRSLRLTLAHPSTVVVGGGDVDIDHLRLAVNRGAIAVDGTVGRSVDADVAIERLELADLEPLGLPVRLAGRLEARASAHGRVTSPDVALIADASGLVVDGHRLGRVGVAVDLAAGRLDARVGWTPSPREEPTVHARTTLGPLDALGGIAASRHGAVALEVAAKNLDLARMQPWFADHTIHGRVDADVEVTGTAVAPTVTASIDGRDLRFDDLVIDAVQARVGHDDGRVALDVGAHTPWIDSVHLVASLPVRVAAVAPYVTIDRAARGDVTVAVDHLDLSGLETFAPDLDLRGHVDGKVAAALDHGALSGSADVLVRDLARAGDRIATVSLDATLDERALTGTLLASGPAARLVQLDATVPLRIDVRRGEIAWLDDQPHHVALTLADADIAALGRLANVAGFSGRIDGTASLDGTPRTPTIVAELRARRIAKDSHAVGRVELDVEHRAGHLRVRALQRQGRQRLDLDADLPVTIDLAAPIATGTGAVAWDRSAEHKLDVDAVAIDRELITAFVDIPDDAVFDANLEVHAHGHAGDFAAWGQLRAMLGEGAATGTPVAARFAVGDTQQDVEIVLGPFADRAIEITATTQAPVVALLGGGTDWRTIPIVAALDTDGFRLSAIDPLLPDAIDDPSGRLDAHLKLDGTLGAPGLHGGLAVADGAVTVVPLRQRFDRVGVTVELDRRDVRLTRFSARSGAGRARGTGRLHLEPGATEATVDLRIEGLAIVRPGLPLMKLTTRATATLDATGSTTDVEVVVRKSTLDVFTESMTAPQALPDATGVVYLDARGRADAKASTAGDPQDPREPLLPPDMNVRLVLADPLYVRGPQANMTWRGKVEVTRRGDADIRAEGALVVDRGRISFLGKDFVIDSGSLTLPEQGELDPYIALTAITQTPEGTVTIDVHGRVSRPELRLSSDPPLAESDVFALLVTGSSSGAKDGGGADVEAKAANLLAAFQNPVLQRQLQDRLGIDRVGITFGDTVEQPIVAVGKRVAPKLYLETRYHHNAPMGENHAELHLQYEIKAPSWSVETFIGDAAKGGLELWWRKRFGRPRAPKEKRARKVAGPPAAESTTAP